MTKYCNDWQHIGFLDGVKRYQASFLQLQGRLPQFLQWPGTSNLMKFKRDMNCTSGLEIRVSRAARVNRVSTVNLPKWTCRVIILWTWYEQRPIKHPSTDHFGHLFVGSKSADTNQVSKTTKISSPVK